MCRRADAIEELRVAANCLSETCATRIATTAALEGAYRAVLAEPLPPALATTLARLDGKEAA